MLAWDWDYEFGDNKSTRLSVGFNIQQWMVGLTWSNQDICIRLLWFYIDFDWFDEESE